MAAGRRSRRRRTARSCGRRHPRGRCRSARSGRGRRRFHAGPPPAVDPDLELGRVRRNRAGRQEVGQRRLRQREGLEALRLSPLPSTASRSSLPCDASTRLPKTVTRGAASSKSSRVNGAGARSNDSGHTAARRASARKSVGRVRAHELDAAAVGMRRGTAAGRRAPAPRRRCRRSAARWCRSAKASLAKAATRAQAQRRALDLVQPERRGYRPSRS